MIDEGGKGQTKEKDSRRGTAQLTPEKSSLSKGSDKSKSSSPRADPGFKDLEQHPFFDITKPAVAMTDENIKRLVADIKEQKYKLRYIKAIHYRVCLLCWTARSYHSSFKSKGIYGCRLSSIIAIDYEGNIDAEATETLLMMFKKLFKSKREGLVSQPKGKLSRGKDRCPTFPKISGSSRDHSCLMMKDASAKLKQQWFPTEEEYEPIRKYSRSRSISFRKNKPKYVSAPKRHPAQESNSPIKLQSGSQFTFGSKVIRRPPTIQPVGTTDTTTAQSSRSSFIDLLFGDKVPQEESTEETLPKTIDHSLLPKASTPVQDYLESSGFDSKKHDAIRDFLASIGVNELFLVIKSGASDLASVVHIDLKSTVIYTPSTSTN